MKREADILRFCSLKSFGWLICLLFMAVSAPAFSAIQQTDSVQTIIHSLEKEAIGQGTVRIYQDSRIASMIGKKRERDIARNNFSVGKGFRIQVFSGNNQNASKKEAFEREAVIRRDFSDLETYVSFKSPFWRLRIGNFQSYEEAYSTMRKIKEVFPKYGKETYIVKDDIKIYH